MSPNLRHKSQFLSTLLHLVQQKKNPNSDMHHSNRTPVSLVPALLSCTHFSIIFMGLLLLYPTHIINATDLMIGRQFWASDSNKTAAAALSRCLIFFIIMFLFSPNLDLELR